MLLNYQSSNLSQNRKNLMDSNKQIHVGSRSKCEAKRRWKKWPLSVDLASISSTLITKDLSLVWKLTNQNYLSDFNLIWKLNQCPWLRMTMGWGQRMGSSPLPHIVLSCLISALPHMTRKIFLPHSHPLGPHEVLPHSIKLYFLIICPTTITIFFDKTISLIKIYLK